jgi:phage gp36-like protein
VTPTSGEISAARAFAEGYVDAALTPKYKCPFNPVPDLVKFIALDIAAYDVLCKHFSIEDPNVGDLIQQFWSRAHETIARLQAGTFNLHDNAIVDEAAEKQIMASKTTDQIVVTDEALTDW